MATRSRGSSLTTPWTTYRSAGSRPAALSTAWRSWPSKWSWTYLRHPVKKPDPNLLPVGEHTQIHNGSNRIMVLLFNSFQIVYIIFWLYRVCSFKSELCSRTIARNCKSFIYIIIHNFIFNSGYACVSFNFCSFWICPNALQIASTMKLF